MVDPKAQNGAQQNQNTEQQNQRQFAIQRIYVKDMSLEVPNSPKVFLENWEPEMNMDIGTKADPIEQHTYEVVLSLTVTVKIKNTVAFLIEIKQAGIFTLQNFPEEHMRPMLGAFCPNILYPYARATVTDLVIRAGFPQLYLAPVNFDAFYEQHERERQKQAEEGKQQS
nr:protein-export chaperone SecB [Pseudomonadota bacterium]